MNPDSAPVSRWIYAEIEVNDAGRRLRPTHICATEIRFAEPPRLTSDHITITTRNGNRATTHDAHVLAHHPDAQHIPIELAHPTNQLKASTKLTA